MIIIDLSRNIIKKYVEVSTPVEITSNDKTSYGYIVGEGDELYVQLDGSSVLTPISSNVDVRDGDRVLVLIKNHEATVLGSPTSVTARLEELREMGVEVADLINANKVATGEIVAMQALIEDLTAKDVEITGSLTANEAVIESIISENATINGKLEAYQADIEELETNKIDATVVEAKYATIASLEATDVKVTNLDAAYGEFSSATIERLNAHDASITKLDTDKLSATDADLKYANIDFTNIGEVAMKNFYANSGLIDNVVISEGTITGNLVGVTIKGDLIEGGTVVADKLVIQGDDGLYYKLNTDGVTTEAEQTEYNSLDGSIITANTITATKINVDDLVAFDATIGGFNITENSIHSGVKESIDNTTRGVYLDNTGQVNFGDSNNYVKYYYDEAADVWKLAISADQITFGSGKTIEDVIQDAVGDVDVDLSEYYTKEETDAQIKTASDSITLTVSETYATQLSVSDLEDDIVEVTGSLTSQINDTNTNLNALTDDYNATAVQVSEHTTKISSLEQTSSGWTMNFQTLENTVTELNNQFVTNVDEQYKYIRFINGEIWIGKLPEEGSEDLQLVMRNDRISFLLNNTEVAYFSDDALHVTTVNITNSMRLGHFEFKERANGNMGLRWVGE